jgi:hypothetical protein
MEKRLARSKIILAWHAGDNITFRVEKIFVLHMSAVMVWGKSLKKKTKIIDRHFKINTKHCLREVQQNYLGLGCQRIVQDNYFCLQHNRTPSHRSGLKRIYRISSHPTNERQVRLI